MKYRSTPRPNLSPTILSRESEWIARELDMMIEAPRRFDQATNGHDWWLLDASTEIFVLHARLLLEFLWGNAKSEWRDDTVASIDFCQPGPPEPSLPSPREWRTEWLAPAHKLLAHLAVDRDAVKAALGGWAVGEIARAIVTGLEFVIRNATPGSVHAELQRAVQDARKTVP